MNRHRIIFFSIVIFSFIVCITFPSVAYAVDGFPGSTWGELSWEIPDRGKNDAILEGWLRQGIAWKTWRKETSSFQLNTYLTVRYKWDSEELDWNNYIGPGAGVAIDMYRPNGPLVSWGLEHTYQMNYRSGDKDPRSALFMNWFHWWDIQKKGYPGAAWGDLRWDVPNTGKSNVILGGWLRQGITLKHWEKTPNIFTLNPYARVRYKWDSQGLDWNNYVGPGAGISLDMDSDKGPLTSWGVEYNWEKNFQTGDDSYKVILYMRWYAWWDIKKK